jgi:apolipoprotein N-acyltransferase
MAVGLDIVRRHPMLGTGVGDNMPEFRHLLDNDFRDLRDEIYWFPHFHNQYIQIATELGALATPICFDCDYTEVARRFARNGAGCFVVPSFDAESWSARQHLQHAVLFRLRAAENARWLACAASSGVSQIIDPHGNVHASLPPMAEGVVRGSIEASNRLTPFTTVGWLFPWAAMAVTVVLLGHTSLHAHDARRWGVRVRGR